HSCVLLLVRGFRSFAFLFERLIQAVEACFPEVAVLGQPPIELPERLGLEGVEPPLSVRPRCYKSGFVEDSQVPRHTGLVTPRPSNKVIDLLLTIPQGFHDATARRISKGLEGVWLR